MWRQGALLRRLVGEYFADLRVEDAHLVELKTVKSARRHAQDAMHQLSQSNQPAALPAAKFRQVAPGDQARGLRPVNRAEPSACSACIVFLHLR